MWVFRSGEDEGPPIVLYRYYKTRAGANAKEFLNGFNGYLMTDGYTGYNVVPDVTRTACWVDATLWKPFPEERNTIIPFRQFRELPMSTSSL